jgi:hypothetical protein
MTASDAPVLVGPLRPGPVGDQVLDLAATGRAGLAALLGGDAERHALFRPGLRADRFLVATVGGELAGYVSLKYAGRGPFAPGLADFIRCQGWRRGPHAWAVFSWIEARTQPRPRGAYIYGMDVLKAWRGHKHGRDVGGALMAAAIEAMTRLGYNSLDMEVRRPAARALARRAGAVPAAAAPRLSLTRLLMATAGDYERLTIVLKPEARHAGR